MSPTKKKIEHKKSSLLKLREKPLISTKDKVSADLKYGCDKCPYRGPTKGALQKHKSTKHSKDDEKMKDKIKKSALKQRAKKSVVAAGQLHNLPVFPEDATDEEKEPYELFLKTLISARDVARLSKNPNMPYYASLLIVFNPKMDILAERNAKLDQINLPAMYWRNKNNPRFHIYIYFGTSITEGPCHCHSDASKGFSNSSGVTELVRKGNLAYFLNIIFSGGTTEENKRAAFKWNLEKKLASHIKDGFGDDKHHSQIKYLNKAIGGPSIDINSISKEEFEELFWSVACNEIPTEVLNTKDIDYAYYPLTETVPTWDQLEDNCSPVPEKRRKHKRRKVVGAKGMELRKKTLAVSKTNFPTPPSTPVEELDDEDEERSDSICGNISSSIAANCRERSKNKLKIVERIPEMDAYEDHVEWMNELYEILNSIQTNKDKSKPYYGSLMVVINPKEDTVKDYDEKGPLDNLDVLKILSRNDKNSKFSAHYFADTSTTEGPCLYHTDPIFGKSSLVTKLVLEGRVCYRKNFTFEGKSTNENKFAGLKWQAEYKYFGQVKQGIRKDKYKMQTEIINKAAQGKGIPAHDLVNDEEFTKLFWDAVSNKNFSAVINSEKGEWEYYPLTEEVPLYEQLVDPILESEDEDEEEVVPAAPRIKKKAPTVLNGKSKPPLTYSELAEIAVRNSSSLNFSSAEILHFVRFHFPYFKNGAREWTKRMLSGIKISDYLNPDCDGLGKKSYSRVSRFSSELVNKFDDKIQKIFNRKENEIKASLEDEGLFEVLKRGLLNVNYRNRIDLMPMLRFPYIVATAISSTDSKQITTTDLKKFIADNYPYFAANPKKVRDALSDVRHKNSEIMTRGDSFTKEQIYYFNPLNEN